LNAKDETVFWKEMSKQGLHKASEFNKAICFVSRKEAPTTVSQLSDSGVNWVAGELELEEFS